MKIACAAPIEMENYIEELKEQLLYQLLPQYMLTEELEQIHSYHLFKHNDQSNHLYNGLLNEALQVISSLQTVIAVIESIQNRHIQSSDREIFTKNIKTLEKYGLVFPIPIDSFMKENHLISYSQDETYKDYVH
ncbi:hypothetical protein FZC66_17115 [Priestia megaterium]|nr:hypothetical protein FZC66_17115 [Priestia megaterium]